MVNKGNKQNNVVDFFALLEVTLHELNVTHPGLCFLVNFLVCCPLVRRVFPASVWHGLSAQ